jgi:predicted nucleic acid-binding protein
VGIASRSPVQPRAGRCGARRLCRSSTSHIEDPASVAKAFDWMQRGMDFADALHLAKAAGCDAFVSFDQRLISVADAFGDVKVRLP